MKIRETLKAIASQKTNYAWELIFIDNNSLDDTYSLASDFLSLTTIDYLIERCSQPGKMNAFWKGIEMAKYDYILDCDDDNHFSSDYIQIGLEYLLQNDDVGALGGQGLLYPRELPDWFEKYKKSFALGPQGIHLKKYFDGHGLYGAGCFYRKSILFNLRKKGFQFALNCRQGEKLSSGGDIELCYLLTLSGYSLVYLENLKFYHDIPKDRISWTYYIKLKKGISSSAGLLFPYLFLKKSSSKGQLNFFLFYYGELAKSAIIFCKYRILWGKIPKYKEQNLALEILKSRYLSFKANRQIARKHFKQLLIHFG